MARIVITRADETVKTLAEADIVAVLSIEHPGVKPGDKGSAPRIGEHGFSHVPQKILAFWDSEQAVNNGPNIAQVEEGLDFVMAHLESGTVLIHCHAGKSRSVAIALGALALSHPDKDETELLALLLEIRPVAAPNILIVEMVDKIAGRDGKLLQAVLDHPKITEQRAAAEKNRQEMLERRPELLKEFYPEKFFKP